MPKPSLRSILPDYFIGLSLGVVSGLLTQFYLAAHDSIILAFAAFFGALSVAVLGNLLRSLL
jgi:hypothetical protein